MAKIREATLDDAPAIAALITYLGYETTPEDMRLRLQNLSASPDYVSLVATEEENVVGFLGLAFSLYFERTGIYARIAALSVAPDAQGKGVGGALVRAAEKIAKSRHALVCIVNSGAHRVEAHKFYEHLGFVAKGKAFLKPLAEI